jgi:hypothetical protein
MNSNHMSYIDIFLKYIYLNIRIMRLFDLVIQFVLDGHTWINLNYSKCDERLYFLNIIGKT